MICITENTKKMGDVPSISLDPWVDCTPNAPCKNECYARALCRIRTTVRAAWHRNSELARLDLPEYFAQLNRWLRWRRPRYFRFHVGGDIPTRQYAEEMRITAQLNRDVKMLVFTKRLEYLGVLDRRETNLAVVFSFWPGWLEGVTGLQDCGCPCAWFTGRHYPEPRIPVQHHKCPGHCYECGYYCWRTDGQKLDVVFHKKERSQK